MKKIGIIGVGKMGLSHMAIASMTEGLQVVAVCDVSTPLMNFIGKNTGVITYKKYTKMIEETQPDAVIICVPNAIHYEIAKHCIEREIDIFIEKPLTLDTSESARLCELSEKFQVKVQVGYVNRFNPVYQRVKHIVETGAIGEITSYVNKMIGAVILKENSKGWRNDYRKGGGCLFDYGPHCFDLSTFLFGSNVEVASAFLKSIYSTKVDDVVSATFLHDNKIVGFNYVNWSDNSVRKASNTIEIVGTDGKITANKQDASIFLNEDRPAINMKKGWNQLYITDECTDTLYYLRGEEFSRQLTHFSEMINGRVTDCLSPIQDAHVVDMLLADVYSKSGGLIQHG